MTGTTRIATAVWAEGLSWRRFGGAAITIAGDDDVREVGRCPPLPVAAPESVGFDPERLDRLDGAMQGEIDAGHYAGISVMVARRGKLVKFGAYGYQSLETGAPLRGDATSASRR